MDRNELAKALHVPPWDIDDWLLGGCPATQIKNKWIFDQEKIEAWLTAQNIKIKRIKAEPSSPQPGFDPRWLRSRCPICIDRGFPAEKAGKVYTLGEISEGEWHLRRAGIPCGHSVYLDPKGIFA